MNFVRWFKGWFYAALPAGIGALHGKRRKGLFYRYAPEAFLECQREQDRIFWEKILRPSAAGEFLELGGDGVIGSHTLGLELIHRWKGSMVVLGSMAKQGAYKARKCRVTGDPGDFTRHGRPGLLAVHRPAEFPGIWDAFRSGDLRPKWVVVENREPDPQWCQLLERSGYRLRFFFHDDEYFKLES